MKYDKIHEVIVLVSMNGHKGYCAGCGSKEARLADAKFPDGTIVHSINCPACLIHKALFQRGVINSACRSDPEAAYLFVAA